MEFGDCIYSLIKDMYKNIGTKRSVKSGPYLFETSTSHIGVRQGDILSPNLFKIFINDLEDNIRTDKDTPCLQEKSFECLLYADDLVLLSTSENGLQKSLNGLGRFCQDWRLSINTNKTKIMIFNKAGKLLNTHISICQQAIECVKSYKYLGILFSNSGKFTNAKKDLLQRGYKSMFKLTSMFKMSKPNFTTCMHLCDHVVKPVLLYGSEIWCDSIFNNNDNIYNLLKNDIVEACQLKFCRYVLGVNKKAQNIGVYGDTGRFPIAIDATMSFMKYWHRLVNSNEQHEDILYYVYKENRLQTTKNVWFTHVINMTSFINVNINLTNVSKSFYINKLKTNLKNVYIKGWKAELFSDERKANHGNKLRMYRKFKSEFKTESYIKYCNNENYRTSLARFRLGAHRLNIETLCYVKP